MPRTTFLERHSWEEYAAWHLGLTDGAADETKARYAFVFGDFRRVHRTGLIACVYRASEWRHKEVELAAHDLLQQLDATSGCAPLRNRGLRVRKLDRRKAQRSTWVWGCDQARSAYKAELAIERVGCGHLRQ